MRELVVDAGSFEITTMTVETVLLVVSRRKFPFQSFYKSLNHQCSWYAIIKETFHCLTTALLYNAEFNLRVNDKVNRFLKLRGHLIQEVLIAILITCFLSFYNFIFYIFCNQRVRKLKNCSFANGFNLMNSRVIKKILLLNQRVRDAVTCVAHIYKKVTRSFAPYCQAKMDKVNRNLCISSILKKCRGKFECLIYEMLFIQEKKPKLNTQSDSITAKLFST